MHHLPRYILASIAISLGGFLNGFDTGSIGAITTMPQFTTTIAPLSPTLQGFTVSLIMLAGAIPSVFAGWLADHHGRLRAILLGAAIFSLGALLQASAKSGLAQFLAGRTLAGLGEGVYLSTMSVYISEIAPTRHRGVLAGLPQLMSTAGICAGYFTCYGSVRIGETMAWRMPFVVMVVLGLALVALCTRLPESPRWMMSRGDQIGALHALRRLHFSLVEAEREFLGGDRQATVQSATLSPWQSFVLLFRRGYRTRTVLALFVLGMVQLSGIDGVLYVSILHNAISSLCVSN